MADQTVQDAISDPTSNLRVLLDHRLKSTNAKLLPPDYFPGHVVVQHGHKSTTVFRVIEDILIQVDGTDRWVGPGPSDVDVHAVLKEMRDGLSKARNLIAVGIRPLIWMTTGLPSPSTDPRADLCCSMDANDFFTMLLGTPPAVYEDDDFGFIETKSTPFAPSTDIADFKSKFVARVAGPAKAAPAPAAKVVANVGMAPKWRGPQTPWNMALAVWVQDNLHGLVTSAFKDGRRMLVVFTNVGPQGGLNDAVCNGCGLTIEQESRLHLVEFARYDPRNDWEGKLSEKLNAKGAQVVVLLVPADIETPPVASAAAVVLDLKTAPGIAGLSRAAAYHFVDVGKADWPEDLRGISRSEFDVLVGTSVDFESCIENARMILATTSKKAAIAATRPEGVHVAGVPGSFSADPTSKAFVAAYKPVIHPSVVPLSRTRGLASVRAHLHSRWPHAVSIVDILLSELQEGGPTRLPAILLVGSPGSGKTRLLRETAEALSLHPLVYPCGGVGDSSFGGTPSQWTSRRVSVPLDQIRLSGIANPAIVLDEIEKTSISTHNGSMIDTLLQFLEKETASSHFDPGLETAVDLSRVSYLATANDILSPQSRGVTGPLADRFRIVAMPDPDRAAALSIVPRMIAEQQVAAGVPRNMLTVAEDDEIEMVVEAWGKGSLRRLGRAVEAFLRE